VRNREALERPILNPDLRRKHHPNELI